MVNTRKGFKLTPIDQDKRIAELEKENRLLGERCNQLLKDKGGLTDKVAELENQIEKMKCCGNCAKYDRHNRVCSRSKFLVIETLCNCSEGWELRK